MSQRTLSFKTSQRFYRQLKKRADRRGVSLSDYLRSLVITAVEQSMIQNATKGKKKS